MSNYSTANHDYLNKDQNIAYFVRTQNSHLVKILLHMSAMNRYMTSQHIPKFQYFKGLTQIIAEPFEPSISIPPGESENEKTNWRKIFTHFSANYDFLI